MFFSREIVRDFAFPSQVHVYPKFHLADFLFICRQNHRHFSTFDYALASYKVTFSGEPFSLVFFLGGGPGVNNILKHS